MNSLIKLSLIIFGISITHFIAAQKTYFIDGYHGGIYGHYPGNFTSFINQTLENNPDWKINLEIEPESWDSIKIREPQAYLKFKKYFESQNPVNSRIEFVNPTYAQSYLFNISGESIIRQFDYGIQKLKKHFPNSVFETYSSEEPCFTSALPGILRSFGFKYASLKNPNTCWGGYTNGYNAETVNWVGPDNNKIITVPRYASEKLVTFSTWQTEAWTNSRTYFLSAFKARIKNPVGMCLQDAGWRDGPWLRKSQLNTQYTTWHNYFENIAEKPSANWKLSQEDIRVSLVWGSQKLQQIAQMVRKAESKLLTAEKISAIAGIFAKQTIPDSLFDEAWRNLLLAQHHDCWIVPLNWYDRVQSWTTKSELLADEVIKKAQGYLADTTNKTSITVVNTSGHTRSEVVSIILPFSIYKKQITILDDHNTPTPSQINVYPNRDSFQLLFLATIPPTTSCSFHIGNQIPDKYNGAIAEKLSNGNYLMESDLYKIIINKKSGTIEKLITKSNNKNIISDFYNRKFNEIKGFFYEQNKWISSRSSKKQIAIIENGPLRSQINISGNLDMHHFTQAITLTYGQKRIDFQTRINWSKNEGIGDGHAQGPEYDTKDFYKAFYVDTAKLSISFPVNMKNIKLYKDAPFDVTESKLGNTFFKTWDSIKNNIIYRWVDISDEKQGFSLFTDHTTSYSQGKAFPLSLTIAYSGKGLWDANYQVQNVTDIHYSIMPHTGNWEQGHINHEADLLFEPMLVFRGRQYYKTQSIFDLTGTGYELTSYRLKKDTLIARFYNSEGNYSLKRIHFGIPFNGMQWIELNGESDKPVFKNNKQILIDLPRLGFKTLQVY